MIARWRKEGDKEARPFSANRPRSRRQLTSMDGYAGRIFGRYNYATRTTRYWLFGEAFGRFFSNRFWSDLLFTITSSTN